MIEGFKKIDLNNFNPEKREVVKIEKKAFKMSLKKKGFLIAFLIIFVIFLTLGVFLPAKIVYGDALDSLREAKQTYHAFKNQDIERAKRGIEQTRRALKKTKDSFKFL